MSTYEQLFALCEHHIVAYRDDLVKHDKAWLEDNPGVPFLHFTRNYGTHLIPMPPADHDSWPAPGQYIPYLFGHADREHILDQTIPMVKGCCDDSRHELVRHFDGQRFYEITEDKAKQIARDYVLGVEYAWKVTRRAIA